MILICLTLFLIVLISYVLWNQRDTNGSLESDVDIPANYNEELMMDKIIETDFSNIVFQSLQKQGYELHESAGYQFISDKRQVITLSMYDIDIYDEKVVQDIQHIIDSVSQENGFPPFHVEIHVIHR